MLIGASDLGDAVDGIGLFAPSLGVGFYGAFAIGKISPAD
jgi:hypothetical protein